jgi:hypothetical protein
MHQDLYMTTYTKRDLRAADMFAMILVGFGVVLLVFAALPLLIGKSGKLASLAKGGGTNPALWILAGVFVVLGVALNWKIKQLVRNRGSEPEDYPGVSE